MIDPKNMNTWPVAFVEQGDVDKIKASDGFKSWLHSIGAAPENCIGFNRYALVVYILDERQSLNDYCFGGVREHNKLLVNDNRFLKLEMKKLNEEVYNLIIERDRLKKFKADLGDLPYKYNHLVKENANLEDENKSMRIIYDRVCKLLNESENNNRQLEKKCIDLENVNKTLRNLNEVVVVTVENLQKQLATSEATVKETLKIKQKLFDEAQVLRVINERLTHENLKASAPSSELQKENWKLHNEAIVLKTRIDNLEREKKCMIENFNAKLSEDNLVHENDIKNLNNTIIRLRSDDGNHVVQSLQKGIERLKKKIAEYQNDGREMGLEVSNLRQEVANLRHRNKVLEASIGSKDREIARLTPFEGSYDRWQLENRTLQEKLDNIKKSLSGFAGKI